MDKVAKRNETAECCKGLTGICNNWDCLHYDQHRGRRDASASLNEKGCTNWHWCYHIKAKVRCLMKNTIG